MGIAFVNRCVLVLVLAAPAFYGGCVIQDELADDIQEVIPTMKFAALRANGNGSGQLDFVFNYQLGMRDPEGIEQIDWRYRLVTRDQAVLGQVDQRMRKPDLDKVEVLVQGDRTRKLPVARGLVDGETYIIWVTMYYRGEIFDELLTGIVANGEPVVNDEELPEIPPLP